MELITRLSNERIEELTLLRLEKGLNNIINLLEVNELLMYMINIEEAIQRTAKNMLKYKIGGTCYNSYKEMNEELLKLKDQLQVKIDEVSKPVLNTKKVKLTDTQLSLLEDIKNANYSYQKFGKTINHHVLYNNGELETYKRVEGGIQRKSEVTIIGDNRYTLRANTKTLQALEKKGYINILLAGGDAYDIIELVEPTEQKIPFFELEEVNVSVTYYSDFCKCKLTDNQTLYCPIGQANQTLEAHNEIATNNYNLVSVNKIKVDTWKG